MNSSSIKLNTYTTLFLVAIALLLSAPLLLANGMFMDGCMYASIARNLAMGKGTLWNLCFSNTCMQEFHEHPPLVFWMQGALFYVLGDSIYVERLYSLLILLYMVNHYQELRNIICTRTIMAYSTSSYMGLQ
jgi:4-amino-4-deoxy-L-arabinose transferase-like glycosyltransferase